MAGKAHAAAYRTASALYSPVLPPVRLVSIGDVNAEFGSLAADAFRLRAQRHLVAGDRRGRRHRRRQRRHRELAAPRSRGGPAGRRQARAVREAAERLARGRPGHGRGRPQRQFDRPHRLHLPPHAGHRLHPRPHPHRRAGQRPALQRPLLDRLRIQPVGAHELALQGRPGLRCAGRRRQPPGVRLRVPLRRHQVRQRRAPEHRDRQAPAAAGRRHGPRPRRGQRHFRGRRERRLRCVLRRIRKRCRQL